MWIKRDLMKYLSQPSLPVQVLTGPRQGGKSTLFHHLEGARFNEVSLDDLQARRLAEADPAFFLKQNTSPLFIDEAPYAPNLFPQIKLEVDLARRRPEKRGVMFRLTGSNQLLIDRNVKESLARANYFRLHPLSVHEVCSANLSVEVQDMLFSGGWPELYANPEISTIMYLNDYIQTYVEKDFALLAGIEKLGAFQTVLGLLAARTGQLLNFKDVARDAGISSVTVKDWVLLLERNGLCGLLRPFWTNLNKRLIKTPKFYFLDTGLACRLQGHQAAPSMMKSPQIGQLFETLVLSEIIKTRDHHARTWQPFFWRTKEKEEYDFIIVSGDRSVVLDARLAIHAAQPIGLSPALKKALGGKKIGLGVVTYGGKKILLNRDCWQIPIHDLSAFLIDSLG
ncbi:MAG: hypothetical protein C5B49_01240 [Bdellovibrio sp.]|nr:MAG: hypothetical protein C5B49_01240 [Bdellovibrio sp.]